MEERRGAGGGRHLNRGLRAGKDQAALTCCGSRFTISEPVPQPTNEKRHEAAPSPLLSQDLLHHEPVKYLGSSSRSSHMLETFAASQPERCCSGFIF
ncbi:hypothetical protein INR49_016221 [Caranx melampygus]|nr:hypothetical protein INR49_016221 [Caranx melampygus]